MWATDRKKPVSAFYLRAASPNERRCIEREALGFYGALVVGGVYEFCERVEIVSISTYVHALRECIDSHPQLGSAILGAGTCSPYYETCSKLNLTHHFEILKSSNENEIQDIKNVLPELLDVTWLPSILAWKISVMPFSQKRCFIAFSCSHALGDGMSGLAFHRTFLNALQNQAEPKNEGVVYAIPAKRFYPPFDTPENLPISWSFLLSPLLGAYLPNWLASLFGFKASISPITAGTWTGSSVFHDAKNYHSNVEILRIDAAAVAEMLKICRQHGAKMTGLLHELIVASLSEELAHEKDIDNLVARTAINMRGAVGVSTNEIGNFISGISQSYSIKNITEDDKLGVSWETATLVTAKLAAAANKLQDQPIGLLRYLKDIRGWVLSQVGKPRDCSYEVSNLVSFNPSGPTERCSVDEMVFCQPSDVIGGPLSFNIVSVADGPIFMAVSWQERALGLGPDKDEREFIVALCQHIRHRATLLASSLKEEIVSQ